MIVYLVACSRQLAFSLCFHRTFLTIHYSCRSLLLGRLSSVPGLPCLYWRELLFAHLAWLLCARVPRSESRAALSAPPFGPKGLTCCFSLMALRGVAVCTSLGGTLVAGSVISRLPSGTSVRDWLGVRFALRLWVLFPSVELTLFSVS